MCCAFPRHLCCRMVLTRKLFVSLLVSSFLSVLSHLFCKLRRSTTGQLQSWVPLFTSNLYRSAKTWHFYSTLPSTSRSGRYRNSNMKLVQYQYRPKMVQDSERVGTQPFNPCGIKHWMRPAFRAIRASASNSTMLWTLCTWHVSQWWKNIVCLPDLCHGMPWSKTSPERVKGTWWFIPLSKWVITLVINGISGGNVHL